MHRSHACTLLAIGLVLLSSRACSDAGTSAGKGAIRDSAGIRIVTNPPEEALRPDQRWSVADTLSIGRLEGPEEYSFNQLSDLAVDGEGRVYALDWGDNLVKVYDSTGTYVSEFGGKGEGPSEFQAALRLSLWADTVTVYDFRLQKLAYFRTDGSLIRTARPELVTFKHGFPETWSRVRGGFAVTTGGGCSLPAPEDRRPRWRALALDADGGIRGTLANRVAREVLALYGEHFCSSAEALAGPKNLFAARGDGTLAWGAGDVYEVALAPTDPLAQPTPLDELTPTLLIRRSLSPTPVSHDEIAAYRKRHTTPPKGQEVNRDQVAALEAAWDSLGFPDYYPFISRLIWDDRGRLWVGRALKRGDKNRVWDVYGDDGLLLGQVSLPSSVDVHAATGSWVWGIAHDALGVSYLKGYRIAEP